MKHPSILCQRLTELEGSNQISVEGVDDKREITEVMGASCTGELLPPQLIYTADVILFSTLPKHWMYGTVKTNESTTLRYSETILKPNITTIQQELNSPLEQKSVLIRNVFRAHRTPTLTKNLLDKCIVCVPSNYTSDL